MPMVKISTYLTMEQCKALSDVSAESGAPMAVLIRRSIDMYLETKKKPGSQAQGARPRRVVRKDGY